VRCLVLVQLGIILACISAVEHQVAQQNDATLVVPASLSQAESVTEEVFAVEASLKNMTKKSTTSFQNLEGHLEAIRNGVVQLRVVGEEFLWDQPFRAPARSTSFGSGWFIDNDQFDITTGNDLLIITNAHVAKQAGSLTVLLPELGEEPIAAEAVGICVQRDIALVKIKDPVTMMRLYTQRTGYTEIIKMKLGDSDKMIRGTAVTAVGYPLGFKGVKATEGIISGYQLFEEHLYLSITAPINPGNSGGPLYNSEGLVIGMNTAKFTNAEAIAFAIPSNQIKVVLNQLYITRELVEPEIGIITNPGSRALKEFITGSPTKGGLYVKHVEPTGLYAQAGGLAGDILLAVNGKLIDQFGKIWIAHVKDRFNLHAMLLRQEFGKDVCFEVYRAGTAADGERTEGDMLKLKTLYSPTPLPTVHKLYEEVISRPRYITTAGFVFMDLNMNLVDLHFDSNPQELVKYLDSKNLNEQAVIITNVIPTSLAHNDGTAHGLEGFLVHQVNGHQVATLEDLCRALNGRLGPEDFWTVTTSKSLTALKVGQVDEYDLAHKRTSLYMSNFAACKGNMKQPIANPYTI